MRAFFAPLVPPRLSRGVWLGLAAFAVAVVLWLHGPIAQWPDYHAFADRRAWLGMPNAANVLSNLPFLAVAVWALWRLRAAPAASPTIDAWRLFALALAGTAIGSSIYHWAPSNDTLVGDRLPIAWACAALLLAFLGERVRTPWGRRPVIAVGLAAATFAVAFWWATEQAGQGDLRPYLYLQVLAMLLVPMGLLLRLPATTPVAASAGAWWAVIGCYAAAKLFELADHGVFTALAGLSGHTLKHLAAAAGAAWLLHGVVRAQVPAAQLR